MEIKKLDSLLKLIVFGSIILIIFFVIFGIKYSYQNKNNQTESADQEVTHIPTPTIVRDPDKLGKTLKPIISPSGNTKVLLKINKNLNLKIQMLNDKDGIYRIAGQGDEATSEDNTDILEQMISKSEAEYLNFVLAELWNYKEPTNTIAAISPNDNSMAIMMPNKIIIIMFETDSETVVNQNYTYSIPILRIIDKIEFPINLVTEQYFRPEIFYSDEGNVLYFSNPRIDGSEWIYRFDLINKEFETIDHILPRDIYPLNNSDGLVYWGKPDQITDRSELDHITLEHISSPRTIEILDNRQDQDLGGYDYSGFITVNSNHTALCAERGASGYWGYVIGRISGNQLITIDSGIQYSYCIGWLNNNEAIVEEISYHNQHIKKTYLYNIQSQEKRLIKVEDNEKF